MSRREKIRISADRRDKGYRADWSRFAASLDGVVLPRCVTADEEEGLAIVAAEGTIGQLPLMLELRGAVKINRLPDGEHV